MYEVLKYVTVVIVTNSTYLNTKYLVLLSFVVCRINLSVYDKASRYLTFLTTLVDDILRYI